MAMSSKSLFPVWGILSLCAAFVTACAGSGANGDFGRLLAL